MSLLIFNVEVQPILIFKYTIYFAMLGYLRQTLYLRCRKNFKN